MYMPALYMTSKLVFAFSFMCLDLAVDLFQITYLRHYLVKLQNIGLLWGRWVVVSGCDIQIVLYVYKVFIVHVTKYKWRCQLHECHRTWSTGSSIKLIRSGIIRVDRLISSKSRLCFLIQLIFVVKTSRRSIKWNWYSSQTSRLERMIEWSENKSKVHLERKVEFGSFVFRNQPDTVIFNLHEPTIM